MQDPGESVTTWTGEELRWGSETESGGQKVGGCIPVSGQTTESPLRQLNLGGCRTAGASSRTGSSTAGA